MEILADTVSRINTIDAGADPGDGELTVSKMDTCYRCRCEDAPDDQLRGHQGRLDGSGEELPGISPK